MTRRLSIMLIAVIACAGCATAKGDYTLYGRHFPASILVLPPVNRSGDASAPNTFLASITVPLAERGYYVFPMPLSLETLAGAGLADPAAAAGADTKELCRIFGADAVLYPTIERWTSDSIFFSMRTEIAISYELKDARTGVTIWEGRSDVFYEPEDDGSLYRATNDFSLGVAAAWPAPPYLRVAELANRDAIWRAGSGLPFGKYNPKYRSDFGRYPGLTK